MRVAIIAKGSRGDAQPYVALAHGLQARGHEACVFTNADHVHFVESHGIKAIPVYPPEQDLIQAYGGFPSPTDLEDFFRFKGEWTQTWMSSHSHHLQPCLEALAQYHPQLLVHSPGVGDAFDAEESLGIPAACACLCSDALGLALPHDALLGMSPLLVPEWRNCLGVYVTGFWHLGTRIDGECSSNRYDKLRAFLGTSHDLPVYIGWGSVKPKSMSPSQMLVLALRVLYSLGQRGIIVSGWSGMDAAALDDLCHDPSKGFREQDKDEQAQMHSLADFKAVSLFAKEHVHLTSEAPHEWLFPQCACIVHHGGAGTTGAALRSGRPQVITPVWCDQFTQAKKIQKLGLGRGLKELRRLSAPDLAEAIQSVLGAECMQEASRAFSNKLKDEDGVNMAVNWLDEFYKRNCPA